MTKKFLVFIFTLCCSIGTSKGQEAIADEIIAKVDSYIILKSDLEFAYQQALANGQYSSNLKCDILSQLVTQKLMIAKAEIDSIIVTDEEVEGNLDRRMQMIIQQTGGSEERLEEYYGKKMDQIREEVRDNVEEQLIVQRMQAHITEGIGVTPAEVKRFFNRIPKDSIPFFSTEVEVGHIVKIPEIGKTQKNEASRKLLDIKKKIEDGASFKAMAQQHSQGPSASYGGELGFVKRGAMVPEYEAGALALKPGEISDPVESEFGLHLIQLIERRGNEYNSRHILLQPAPSEDDFKRSIKYLDSLRFQIMNDSIPFAKAAKEYSDDKYTASNGGFLMDGSGASRISTEDLDPVIFFTIDSMQIGQISKPIRFRTDAGKDAVRIIYYKSKVKPHEASLEQDWQKIQGAALNEKHMRTLNIWFENAREDVFIDIDEKYNYCNILQ